MVWRVRSFHDPALVRHPNREADDRLKDDDAQAPDVDGPLPELPLDVQLTCNCVVVPDHVHHPEINEVEDLWRQVLRCCNLNIIVDWFETETRAKVNDLHRADNLPLKVEAYQYVFWLQIAVHQTNLFEQTEAKQHSSYNFLELFTVILLKNVAYPLILNDIVDPLTLMERSFCFE